MNIENLDNGFVRLTAQEGLLLYHKGVSRPYSEAVVLSGQEKDFYVVPDNE